MTVTPKFEKIKADDYKTLAPRQTAVECVLKAEQDSVIKEVLSISCDVSLLAIEGVAGEARYSGRVDFKALYLNAQGRTDTVAYYADFNDKIEDAAVLPVSRLQCMLSVADSEIVSFNKEEIKLLCVIEASVKVGNVREITAVSDGEGFLCNHSSANISNFSGGGKDICETGEEFEEKLLISKILLSDACVIISSVTAGVDCIIAEGEAAVNLTYLCGDDDEEIGCVTKILPFRQEIDAKDVLPADKAFADCELKTLKVNAVVDEENRLTTIDLNVSIEITARAYSSACINYVDDAFAADLKLNLNYTDINSRMFIASFNYKRALEGVAVLDDDLTPAEKILAAAASRVHIANIIPAQGSVTVEGIAVTTVLYSGTKDDVMRLASVNVDIPFSIVLEAEGCRKGDSVNVSAAVFEVEARSRKGREIEVVMQVKMRADLFSDETITVLSQVEAGEEKISDQSSITIYFPSGNERLWDIAKQLGTSPQSIMDDNPDVSFPAAGSKLFIYRQKF